MSETFRWNPTKDGKNLKKHGISFAEAATVFGDPLSITISDPIHSEDEYRFIIIGRSFRDRLLVVVHTDESNWIRIMSARRAMPHEKRDYEKSET